MQEGKLAIDAKMALVQWARMRQNISCCYKNPINETKQQALDSLTRFLQSNPNKRFAIIALCINQPFPDPYEAPNFTSALIIQVERRANSATQFYAKNTKGYGTLTQQLSDLEAALETAFLGNEPSHQALGLPSFPQVRVRVTLPAAVPNYCIDMNDYSLEALACQGLWHLVSPIEIVSFLRQPSCPAAMFRNFCRHAPECLLNYKDQNGQT